MKKLIRASPMKKLVSVLAGTALAVTLVPLLPAGASPKPKVLLSMTGSSSANLPSFTVPASAQHWRLTVSYDCTKLGYSDFGLEVINDQANDVADWDPTALSDSRTWAVNQTGTYIGDVVTNGCKWSVIATAVVPPAAPTTTTTAPKPKPAPGIGSTITVPAIPGAFGQYAVTLLQVINTLFWTAPSGAFKNTRPVLIKIRIIDNGDQPVDLTSLTQGIYWAVGESGFSLSNYGRTYGPVAVGNQYALTGCYIFGNGTPDTLLPGEAAVGCLAFAYSATEPLTGSELWLQSGWLSDGQNLGQLYHWVLHGPPW